ncbi:hypothetical protein SLEP1_g56874 [Rubroshorea leprosula]|uniref:Uncharacterized protein n=1 Tax=Rubroshorea leprosula TaxID=152421 RepID=A0AAV5MJQ9_9ROSI|nr:hypothetical protein SLEP1_g56874 [Rubroshorea leprosula]
MRTEMKRRCLELLTLAVLLILLTGEVAEAASTTRGSINATRISEFIGDQEFLLESEVNARILASDPPLIYRTNMKPAICKDKVYANCLPVGGRPDRCSPYDHCRGSG